MIHLINTRSSCFLEVMQKNFSLDDVAMNKEINFLFNDTVEMLKLKNIDYQKLKNSLLPAHKGYKEIAFIFDSDKIDSIAYGLDIFEHLLPAINHDNNLSILVGDIISRGLDRETLFKIIFENLEPVHSSEFGYSEQYFVVYIAHIKDEQITRIENALADYQPFIGKIDITFDSHLKLLLSMCLCALCIKHKNKIILPHEPDRNDADNINLVGYPFEENGFSIVSINEINYGLFLNFRIDSIYIEENDQSLSLMSISENSQSLSTCNVVIPDEKLQYLKENKAGIMQRLGLEDCTVGDLKMLIEDKISRAHLYNLTYLPEFTTSKFNIFLESTTNASRPAKSMVALLYLPNDKAIQLITLY